MLVNFILGILFSFQVHALDDCSCPTFSCSSCEHQVNLEFYTEKCSGEKGMKSCSKPVCQALDPLPDTCLAENKNKKRDVASTPEPVKEEVIATMYDNARVEIGYVDEIIGRVWVVDFRGQKQMAQKGMKVYEGETLITDKASKVRIMFKDSNQVNLSPDSHLVLTHYKVWKKTKGNVLMDLIKGRVRSRVNQKYKGTETSRFTVKTKSAVAGVRGTDFVVTYEEGSKVITKVETLTGDVILQDKTKKQSQSVTAGKYASYVISANDLFDDQEIQEFVERGYMTPVYKMDQKDLAKLDWDTSLKGERKPASHKGEPKGEFICSSPQGKLDQCAWTCLNNPSGENTCRTDLPQVRCERTRCNANGLWSDQSRVPASATTYCEGNKVVVKPCDY